MLLPLSGDAEEDEQQVVINTTGDTWIFVKRLY